MIDSAKTDTNHEEIVVNFGDPKERFNLSRGDLQNLLKRLNVSTSDVIHISEELGHCDEHINGVGICTNCRGYVEVDDTFCPNCGIKMKH